MWTCKNCGEIIEDKYSICWRCGTDEEGNVQDDFEPETFGEVQGLISSDKILLSNTAFIDKSSKFEVLGLVCSEEIIATDLISKAFAGIVSITGGKSDSYRQYIEEARRLVINNIIEQAKDAGANAITGIKFDYESVGSGMFMVGVTGTALII
ncbi:MAG: heavy metal-binding domain-containing protein [Bacillota bacterium]|nr:heavy metal-binding domain-containing protein [Bacillota bacterium]